MLMILSTIGKTINHCPAAFWLLRPHRAEIFMENANPIAQAEFTPIQRVSVKQQVLQQLKQYIASGVVQPGQRLPSERELAERLGIGRTSVREALKVLEAIGLVESRVGDGTFITAQIGASIGRTIGLGLMTWGGTIVEIMEARRMIEGEAARTAAQRATPADQQAIADELLKMERAANFPEYLAADMNFHRLVGQATHNTIVAQIVVNLIDLLEQVLRDSGSSELMTQAEGDGTHRAVFQAIQRGDAAAAAAAMQEHIHFSLELWQAVISLGSATSKA
jgi:GntR family transcriptional repressor for pyruvate dehydrogenase complex